MLTPIRRVGASKLATVSECQNIQGTHVALKQFDRQNLSAFQHDRIFSAAARWKDVKASCLVPYIEVSPAENQIVMELFDRSAAVRLSEGHSDPRLVLHMLRDILMALAYLHEQGLLHCNLKPTNVFFGADGRARLSDGMLVPAHAPGTLPPPINQKYLSPEHTSDAFGPMSAATDLYTAGFLALELLAGDRFGRAFQGIGDDAGDDDLAWFQWHGSSQEAPSAKVFAKVCPPELVSAIARLVAKNPAERYASARQALQDLPQDISIEFRTPEKVAAESPPIKREALASHVIERPATGIVLAIASGARAGEMVGTNDSEFFIGFDHDCFVRFSGEQYPDINAKLLVRRGPDGWSALRVRGESTFINQRLLEEKATLRSGDMLRLSARGPDVQFTMQSGGVAIRSLVNRFLPEHTKGPARPAAPGRATTGQSVAGQAAPVHPTRQAVATAGGSAKAGVVSAELVKPGGHAAPSHSGAAPQPPGARSPVSAPSATGSASAPGSVAPSRAAPSRPAAGNAPGPGRPQAAVSAGGASGKGSWLDPKSWDKNQKNVVIAVVGGLLVIILVILFPTGSEPEKRPEPPNSTASPAESSEVSDADEGASGSSSSEDGGQEGDVSSDDGN